jgi:WD40-like Beta Propeller Repeat
MTHNILLFVVIIGIVLSSIPGLPRQANVPERLAYVHSGDLRLKSLPAGTSRQVSEGGQVEYPQWSSSGNWLSYRQGLEVVIIPAKADSQQKIKLKIGSNPAAWSTKRDELAFIDEEGLWTIPFDKPDASRRLVMRNASSFVWSSNGDSFAVSVMPQYRSVHLWYVRTDGSGAREIFAPPRSNGFGLAQWSTDDGHILGSFNPDFSASIAADGLPLFSLSADGGAIQMLVQSVLTHPDFISKSTHRPELVVASGGGREVWTRKRLVLVDPATGHATFLTSPALAAISPSWSPDGNQIAYVAGPDDASAGGGERARTVLAQHRIFVMDADGSHNRQLTSDPQYRDEYPRWSRNGQFILFTRMDAADRATVWSVDLTTGTLEKLIDALDDGNPISSVVKKPVSAWFGFYGYIDWSRYLAFAG